MNGAWLTEVWLVFLRRLQCQEATLPCGWLELPLSYRVGSSHSVLVHIDVNGGWAGVHTHWLRFSAQPLDNGSISRASACCLKQGQNEKWNRRSRPSSASVGGTRHGRVIRLGFRLRLVEYLYFYVASQKHTGDCRKALTSKKKSVV